MPKPSFGVLWSRKVSASWFLSLLKACLCVCVLGIFWCEMPNTMQENIGSVVGSKHGQIAHIAGPAVSPMTSLWCGFLENQTSSHSCFHTKPSHFSHPIAFFFSPFPTKLTPWAASAQLLYIKLDPSLAAKCHLDQCHLLRYLAVPRSHPFCCTTACLFL